MDGMFGMGARHGLAWLAAAAAIGAQPAAAATEHPSWSGTGTGAASPIHSDEPAFAWLRPGPEAADLAQGFTNGRSASRLEWSGWRTRRLQLFGPEGDQEGLRLQTGARLGSAAAGFALDAVRAPGMPAAFRLYGQAQAGGLAGLGALLHAQAATAADAAASDALADFGWAIGIESGYGFAVRKGWILRQGLLRPYLAGSIAPRGIEYGLGIDWREPSRPYRLRFSLTEDDVRSGPQSLFSLELLE